MGRKEFDDLIGRCRCPEHARNYIPRPHNRSRTYYFLPKEYIADELLCGACMQSEDKEERGGLILSEEAKKRGVVVFQAFAAYCLSPNQIGNLKRIWPRE